MTAIAAAFLGVVILVGPLTAQQGPGTGAPGSEQPDSTLYACYVPKLGMVYMIRMLKAPDDCDSSHVPFSWQRQGLAGPQGPAGTGGPANGRLESPDGRFTLSLTNGGIELSSPGSSVHLDATGVYLTSGEGTSLQLGPAGMLLETPFNRVLMNEDYGFRIEARSGVLGPGATVSLDQQGAIITSGQGSVSVSDAGVRLYHEAGQSVSVSSGGAGLFADAVSLQGRDRLALRSADLRLASTGSFDLYAPSVLTICAGTDPMSRLTLTSDVASISSPAIRLATYGELTLFSSDAIKLNGGCNPLQTGYPESRQQDSARRVFAC